MSDESLVDCRRLKDSAGGGKSHSELAYRTTGLFTLISTSAIFVLSYLLRFAFCALDFFLCQFCSSVLCQLTQCA